MDRSQEKLKSLIRIRYVAHLKVEVLIYNLILISSPWRVHRPSYPFREIFGVQVKGRSPKQQKLMIEVPYETTGSKLQYDLYLIYVSCS